MAIALLANGSLAGLSTDSKPTTYPGGTKLIETDTGYEYTYNSTLAEWIEDSYSGGLVPKYRRAGYYGYYGSANPFYGVWTGGGTIINLNGGVFSSTQRIGGKTCARHTTGNTINGQVGHRVCGSSNGGMERSQSPWTYWKVAVLTAITNARMFIGYQSTPGAPASVADPLASAHGVGFWFDTNVHATNIAIMANDGDASSDITTLPNVAQMVITTPKTYELRAVGDTKFQYRVDGYPNGAWNDITVNIPVSAQGLNFYWYVETLAATAPKTFDIYEIHHRQDL